MNRLKDNRGETLIESLVSLLILTMTFAFLAVASTTAARLNAKVRDTDVSFGMRRKALTMQGSSFRAPFRLMALKAAYRP